MPTNNNPFLDPPSFSFTPAFAATSRASSELGLLVNNDGIKRFFQHASLNFFGEFALVYQGLEVSPANGSVSGPVVTVSKDFPLTNQDYGRGFMILDGNRVATVPEWFAGITGLTRDGLSVTINYQAGGATPSVFRDSPPHSVLESGLSVTEANIDWGDGTVESIALNPQITTDERFYFYSDGGQTPFVVTKFAQINFTATHTYTSQKSSTGIVIRAESETGFILPTVATHLPLSGDFEATINEDGILQVESIADAILDSTPIKHHWEISKTDPLNRRGGITPDISETLSRNAGYLVEKLKIFLAVSGTHTVSHGVSHEATPGYQGTSASSVRNLATMARAACAVGKSGRYVSLRPRSVLAAGAQIWNFLESFDGKRWEQANNPPFIGTWTDDYTPSIWIDDSDVVTVMGRTIWITGTPDRSSTLAFEWSGNANSTMPFSDPAQWKYVRACPLSPAGICRIAVKRPPYPPPQEPPPAEIFASVWHGAGAWSEPRLVATVPGNPDELAFNQAPDVWQESLQGHTIIVVHHPASGRGWESEDFGATSPWPEKEIAPGD
jgi:hypothetical protein